MTKANRVLSGVLLGAIAALTFAMAPVPADAGPKKHCPPGLAKKGSCIPPGHRKKWARGEYIPREVTYTRVYYQQYNLQRPSSGYFYASIGGDIYLLAEATQRVIEAINLIDAATR